MRTEYQTANEISLAKSYTIAGPAKSARGWVLTAPRCPDLPLKGRACKDRRARLTYEATGAKMAVRYQNPVRVVAPRNIGGTEQYPKRQIPCRVI